MVELEGEGERKKSWKKKSLRSCGMGKGGLQ
jgi:hypothetical protein